jgi:uncharacterized protein (DUF433 family)
MFAPLYPTSPQRRSRRRPDPDRATVVAGYEAGATIAALAAAHDTTRAKVAAALAAAGVRIRPPGRRPVRLDPAVIAAERTAGANIVGLAAAHHTSKTRIAAALEAAGGDPRPLRPNRRDDLDTRVLASAYDAGASLAELAARYRASTSTIQIRLRAAGVSLRPRGRPSRRA